MVIQQKTRNNRGSSWHSCQRGEVASGRKEHEVPHPEMHPTNTALEPRLKASSACKDPAKTTCLSIRTVGAK